MVLVLVFINNFYKIMQNINIPEERVQGEYVLATNSNSKSSSYSIPKHSSLTAPKTRKEKWLTTKCRLGTATERNEICL
jgi:hypothetical protein